MLLPASPSQRSRDPGARGRPGVRAERRGLRAGAGQRVPRAHGEGSLGPSPGDVPSLQPSPALAPGPHRTPHRPSHTRSGARNRSSPPLAAGLPPPTPRREQEFAPARGTATLGLTERRDKMKCPGPTGGNRLSPRGRGGGAGAGSAGKVAAAPQLRWAASGQGQCCHRSLPERSPELGAGLAPQELLQPSRRGTGRLWPGGAGRAGSAAPGHQPSPRNPPSARPRWRPCEGGAHTRGSLTPKAHSPSSGATNYSSSRGRKRQRKQREESESRRRRRGRQDARPPRGPRTLSSSMSRFVDLSMERN